MRISRFKRPSEIVTDIDGRLSVDTFHGFGTSRKNEPNRYCDASNNYKSSKLLSKQSDMEAIVFVPTHHKRKVNVTVAYGFLRRAKTASRSGGTVIGLLPSRCRNRSMALVSRCALSVVTFGVTLTFPPGFSSDVDSENDSGSFDLGSEGTPKDAVDSGEGGGRVDTRRAAGMTDARCACGPPGGILERSSV